MVFPNSLPGLPSLSKQTARKVRLGTDTHSVSLSAPRTLPLSTGPLVPDIGGGERKREKTIAKKGKSESEKRGGG